MSWALVAVAAAAAISAYNTKQTAKKQDRAAAEGIRKQSEEQRKANLRLNETLNQFEDSNSGDIRDQLMGRYGNQIRAKNQQAMAGVNTAGETSSAAKELIKRGGGAVTSRAGDFADLFARIDAPTDQRIGEGMERTDLGSDLSVYTRNSAAQDYLTRLRMASIQRSPWLDILSAGLSGYGSGKSMSGGSTGGATGATVAGSGGQTPQQFYGYR